MIRRVTDYLDAAAEAYPDKEAFIDEDGVVTFGELQTGARRIATALNRLGLFRKPVAVALGQTTKSVAAFLGAAYAGCFYTPIDTNMPESRVQKIFETLEPGAVITDASYARRMASVLDNQAHLLFYNELLQTEPDTARLQSVREGCVDTDVLYVLFTSGSTGTPKGVVVGHRSVVDYVDWVQQTFSITSDTIFGNQAPFYFDNSVLDIYVTLKTGATAYLLPRKLFAFPLRLLEFIRDHKVNTIFWVPSALVRLADVRLLEACDITCLEKILFAGEVMPTKQLNVWRRRLPGALFANLYGPTEITVDCTYWIARRDLADTEPVPIGRPCRNTDILVLNEDNALVQGEEKGELCVRGTSLAYGYYKNPEKTAQAFVQNPLNPYYPELIYRTGDIVHYNARGELICDGRRDFQIKHLGYRIELGEIETAASALREIDRVCCLFDGAKDQIVLFYTGNIAPSDLRKRLAALVPEYMVPKRYHVLEAMPLNLNGKIDRVLLQNRMKNSVLV